MLQPIPLLPSASDHANDTDESLPSTLPPLREATPRSKAELKKVRKGLNSPVRIQRGLSPTWAKVYSRKMTQECDSEIISRTTTLDSLASKAQSPRFVSPFVSKAQHQTFVKTLIASLKKKPKSRNFVKSGFSLSSTREKRPASQVAHYAGEE